MKAMKPLGNDALSIAASVLVQASLRMAEYSSYNEELFMLSMMRSRSSSSRDPSPPQAA
jgi:hypothetical protein